MARGEIPVQLLLLQSASIYFQRFSGRHRVYEMSVPIFIHQLRDLSGFSRKDADHAAATNPAAYREENRGVLFRGR